MNDYYVYLHLRADDGKVFYVGKGRGSRAFRTSARSAHWNRIVAKHGLRAEIARNAMKEPEAYEHERALIASHRAAGAPLCNRTDGGEGGSGHAVTDEVRARISAGHMGKTISPEHRAKISAGNKGRVRSDEFRQKISAALRVRVRTRETSAKLSAIFSGRTISAEQREKISNTLKGRRLSDEERARRRPLTHSAESRAKHSAAMRGRPWSAARRAAQQRRGQPS